MVIKRSLHPQPSERVVTQSVLAAYIPAYRVMKFFSFQLRQHQCRRRQPPHFVKVGSDCSVHPCVILTHLAAL